MNGVYSFVVVVVGAAALPDAGLGLLDGNGCDEGRTEENGEMDECFI